MTKQPNIDYPKLISDLKEMGLAPYSIKEVADLVHTHPSCITRALVNYPDLKSLIYVGRNRLIITIVRDIKAARITTPIKVSHLARLIPHDHGILSKNKDLINSLLGFECILVRYHKNSSTSRIDFLNNHPNQYGYKALAELWGISESAAHHYIRRNNVAHLVPDMSN